MSPVPPNSNGKHPNTNEIKNPNENQVDQNWESDFEITEEGNEVEDLNGEYSALNQNPGNGNDDCDDDDDEDDDDDDFEIHQDVELDFELLASTRAFINEQKSAPTQNIPDNFNYFEIDFFERKNTLEPEEIVLDENKSKKISDLMSNFQLPNKCVPEWAKSIPENVWKQNLIDSINAKKTDLFQLKDQNKN